MTAPYPRRKPFFASRFVRVTVKYNLALKLGPEGVMVLHTIASIEDEIRYSGPVYLPAESLQKHAGIRSKKTFLAVRKRLVEAGWLHYEKGTKSQAAGYWVTVPASHQALLGTPIGAAAPGATDPESGEHEESDGHLERRSEADHVGHDAPDEVSNGHLERGRETDEVPLKVPDKVSNGHPDRDLYNPKPIPINSSQARASEPNSRGGFDDPSDGSQVARPSSSAAARIQTDAPPTPPVTSVATRPAKAPRPRREKRYSAWDREFAGRMAAQLEFAYTIQPPNLDSWAEAIRLLREIDGRTHDEIDAIWEFARKHHFWAKNIQSPDKLRKQWGRLVALRVDESRARRPAGRASPSRSGRDLMRGHREFEALMEQVNGPEAIQLGDDGPQPGDQHRLVG